MTIQDTFGPFHLGRSEMEDNDSQIVIPEEQISSNNQEKRVSEDAFDQNISNCPLNDCGRLKEIILELKASSQVSSSAVIGRMKKWLYSKQLINYDQSIMRASKVYEGQNLLNLCNACRTLNSPEWRDFVIAISCQRKKLQQLTPQSDDIRVYSQQSHNVALMCTAVLDPNISILMSEAHNSLPLEQERSILDEGATLYREQLWNKIKDECNKLALDGSLVNNWTTYDKLLPLNPK